ncbi:DNA-dependent metalloprotease dvc-1-like isoform X2 [Uloborus diversus]|uniref:DNA-dependent metalloprotease dvc-1-like isoform X2 n=1 Tax=Uloborus diversus TaxID=327109 RepID=UPI002409774E|nr:DNA-dependent metalloprotease dvc-1-like isoform X2 [Uloborus diversus]
MDVEDLFYDEKDDYLFQDDAFFEKMDEDLDYAFALSLQMQYNEEPGSSKESCQSKETEKGKHDKRPLSIVDEQWELIDPHPDIRCLFLEYNTKFFYGKLEGVEVKWSPRMKLCAGVCSYEGRGGLCSVRLSLPLLKLRPRRDLVETLLHEMIHAYLFVTHNNKDHNAHGPEFLKHMYRINKETGAKITVYHSFFDEVDLYRTHWWKCDGPCRNRKPFYGLVKRSMNRAPGPTDMWWSQHQATCGGKFVKIREPESSNKGKLKLNENKRKLSSLDNTSFFTKKSEKQGSLISGDSKNSKEKKICTEVEAVKIFGKEDNVVGINTTGKPSSAKSNKNVIPFTGKGFTLGTISESSKTKSVLLDKFTKPTKLENAKNNFPKQVKSSYPHSRISEVAEFKGKTDPSQSLNPPLRSEHRPYRSLTSQWLKLLDTAVPHLHLTA